MIPGCARLTITETMALSYLTTIISSITFSLAILLRLSPPAVFVMSCLVVSLCLHIYACCTYTYSNDGVGHTLYFYHRCIRVHHMSIFTTYQSHSIRDILRTCCPRCYCATGRTDCRARLS
ncbi:hypothetical protein PYCCODRAFT_335601 [Trametes coccinea BRFM310]|uniref:Uncharacterized protein n=1 Tax=Trametes coccinea (strain BRFM310) TaxID=1353009 RepID=A0A1Y2J2L1_TRAC3|nr:hypothetical protein PYCCODRAFT_335601 [Trametes coccinea BRFM310]